MRTLFAMMVIGVMLTTAKCEEGGGECEVKEVDCLEQAEAIYNDNVGMIFYLWNHTPEDDTFGAWRALCDGLEDLRDDDDCALVVDIPKFCFEMF